MRRIALFVALVVLTPSVAGAVTFDDGMLHIIDANNSFPFEALTIRDGPGGSTTIVNFVDGG